MLDVVTDETADGGQDPQPEVDHLFPGQPGQAVEQRRRARETDAEQCRVELPGGHLTPTGRAVPLHVDGNTQAPGNDEIFHAGTIYGHYRHIATRIPPCVDGAGRFPSAGEEVRRPRETA
ncbi:hypothetical protein GCM10023074_12300 [Microbispora amethystogenes]|uniref:Uncharacterized protein n=1 Tax=Microbispora amethystogenes TaxID=1427754 RepID=A0ABQ4FMY8_9ACTN|nr:hypothetical protein Mam01_63440 [Microbispora amethystogenes]